MYREVADVVGCDGILLQSVLMPRSAKMKQCNTRRKAKKTALAQNKARDSIFFLPERFLFSYPTGPKHGVATYEWSSCKHNRAINRRIRSRVYGKAIDVHTVRLGNKGTVRSPH